MKPFKVHKILLDPKKITQIIADVTNACDKEYLADVTKASIIGKTILTESKLKTVLNSSWLFMAPNNSIYGILCTYIIQASLFIYTHKERSNEVLDKQEMI